jgi:hypothetical protein
MATATVAATAVTAAAMAATAAATSVGKCVAVRQQNTQQANDDKPGCNTYTKHLTAFRGQNGRLH